MASKGSFNNHPTCCESFLALSVVVRVNKYQLEMESHVDRAPVFRYGNFFAISELLKQSLAHVCLPLGVHSIGRMRQGTLPLFEVDFSGQKCLEMFCKSLNGKQNIYTIICSNYVTHNITGVVDRTLRSLLEAELFPGQELEVTVKLHLIMPRADKEDSQLTEVTLDNYQECFPLLRKSALFEFGALDLIHSTPPDEETDRQELSNDRPFQLLH